VTWKEGCWRNNILPLDLEKQDVRLWTTLQYKKFHFRTLDPSVSLSIPNHKYTLHFPKSSPTSPSSQ
jgi:hypothetical protein